MKTPPYVYIIRRIGHSKNGHFLEGWAGEHDIGIQIKQSKMNMRTDNKKHGHTLEGWASRT